MRAPRPGGSRRPEVMRSADVPTPLQRLGVLRSGARRRGGGQPGRAGAARARRRRRAADRTPAGSRRGALPLAPPAARLRGGDRPALGVPGGAAAPRAGPEPATFDGHQSKKPAHSGGHQVRLTVAQADLRVLRLAAAAGHGFGGVAETTQLTAAFSGALVGVNGDYFAYNWSGAAVPYGPLVRGGRILRLPPGVLRVVGSDAQGRPTRGRRPGGRLALRRPWEPALVPAGRVGQRRGRQGADRARGGRGPRRPRAGRRRRDPVPGEGPSPSLRRGRRASRGVVVAVGHRLSFGARSTWGRGAAGARDVLLAASGAAGAKLRGLHRGTVVTLSTRHGSRTGPPQARRCGTPSAAGPYCCGTAGTWRPARRPPSSPGPAR